MPRLSPLALATALSISLSLLAAPARAASPSGDLRVSFTDVELSGLSPWDAGRVRLMIWLQVDSCVRRAMPWKQPADITGALTLSMTVGAKGKAKVSARGSGRLLPKAASCLGRALAKSVTFPAQAGGFTWKSKLLLGDEPGALWFQPVKYDEGYVPNQAVFESVLTLQIERAACLRPALEDGTSAALKAEFVLDPGQPLRAKVSKSTHVEDAVLTCLDAQLAAIAPPADAIPAKLHLFFHLLQPAKELPEGEPVNMIGVGP